jgi:hypothetical protein
MTQSKFWPAAGIAGALLFAVPLADLLVSGNGGSGLHELAGCLGLSLLAIAAAVHLR